MEDNSKVIKPENGVSVATIARTICLFLALANQALVMFGKAPLDLDDNVVYQVVSYGATIVTAVVAWWKDNAFTKTAIEAEAYKNELRSK